MNVHAGITDEAEIRALVERCAQGFRDMDIDAIMDCHTEDVVCFDAHSQYEARGAESVRGFLAACMPHMQGPMLYEVHDLSVEAAGGVGFAHYLLRSGCRDLQGQEHGGWLRVTAGLRRTGDGWRASHAHISAPFDPMSEKTMFGQPRDADPFAEGATCSGS